MEVVVRKLGAEDAPAYRALRLEAVEREPRSFGQSIEEQRLVTFEQTTEQICGRDGFLLGAFDGDTLVAHLRFARPPRTKERHKGYIHGVYVTASHRGHGLARKLIAAVIAEMRADPTMEQLLLAVAVGNLPARATYAGLGFVPFGIEPRALKAGDEYIDEEHMILSLQ
jgi:ribosomal protein S18 acetylase RimI-like enzyme